MWGLTKQMVGPFEDIAAANAWAAANPGDLYVGLLASVNGVQYTYGAAGWAGAGVIYNRSTLPIPTTYISPEIIVENLNMPSGKSRLCWDGAKYVPCAGDVIADWSGDPYLTQATPGVQPLYKAYQSPIIPDYLIPDGVILRLNVSANIKNASGIAECYIMACVSGSEPTGIEAADYTLGVRAFAPAPGGTGFVPTVSGYQRRKLLRYKNGAWGVNSQNLGTTSDNASEVTPVAFVMEFVPGSNRLYVKAVTKSVNDTVTVNFAQISVGL